MIVYIITIDRDIDEVVSSQFIGIGKVYSNPVKAQEVCGKLNMQENKRGIFYSVVSREVLE